jgi:hypothetical protein
MTEDYTQEMKFWFGNRYGDESDVGQVHLERGADYLPNVMEAFERFLRQAGFTYIELLTDGESWQFIKNGDLSTFESDCDYFDDVEDLTDHEWVELDRRRDEEAAAYEAERTYDETYYDPFTRDVDWDKVLPWEPEPALKVGAKVRVVDAGISDSSFVFGREGIVNYIANNGEASHCGQTVRVEFPPPAISAGPGHETNVWWVNPDALEVIG